VSKNRQFQRRRAAGIQAGAIEPRGGAAADFNERNTMEELNEYYKQRERKNNELVAAMAWAVAFGFGLGVLYVAARLIIVAAQWIF
jgi:hypothetical protein